MTLKIILVLTHMYWRWSVQSVLVHDQFRFGFFGSTNLIQFRNYKSLVRCRFGFTRVCLGYNDTLPD